MALQEIFEYAGITCRSYSGRGMLGKMCLGVDCDNAFDLFADVLDEIDDLDDLSVLADALREAKTDSMGLGTVVYFPSEKYQEEDKDSKDEEEQ